MKSSRLEVGKLPHSLLRELLAKNRIEDKRVIVTPHVGEDAAAVSFANKALIASTDPITFATDLIGWYAVHVNANDIAVMGAKPKWFLCTVLFPPSISEKSIHEIFDQIIEACNSLGISLIGGHAELTAGIEHPIAVGTMLGEVSKEGLVTSQEATVEDDIVLVGEIAIEGTSLLAREYRKELIAAEVGEEEIDAACELLVAPGISVVKSSQSVCSAAKPKALHDPTEGGVATALYELAEASGIGLEIYLKSIPIHPLCRRFCKKLRINPLGLIASGSLLIASSVENSPNILKALDKAGKKAAIIGKAVRPEAGINLITSKGKCPVPRFARDEFCRFADSIGR